MNTVPPLLLLLFLLFRNIRATNANPTKNNNSNGSTLQLSSKNAPNQNYRLIPDGNVECTTKTLSEARSPTGLNLDIPFMMDDLKMHVEKNLANFSNIAEKILLARSELAGIVLRSSENYLMLALRVQESVKFLRNKTEETKIYWDTLSSVDRDGWAPPFRDCYYFRATWFNAYVAKTKSVALGLFLPVRINQCDEVFADYIGGSNKCDKDTTICVPLYEYGDRRGGYRCVCQKGYYYPGANFSWRGFFGEDIENSRISSYGCEICPAKCDVCDSGGICEARRDLNLRTVILSIQLACMAIAVIIAVVVFKQRKCKTIASGMWTVLETILLGIFLLYATVVVRFFEPAIVQCLLEPWARELGFIICYGAIILKLYRHLIEFRTRKAHRWVVKDTDLLKYLFIMTLSVFAYMAAYTSISLNFMQEDYSLLHESRTTEGASYEACKPLWWDYVTEMGEITILFFGIHLSYASRNARTQFQERNFLCAAISVELAVSTLFYIARVIIFPELHPDLVLIAYFIRTHCTVTPTLLLVFVPKFWYQQKQVRSLAQEYSCRIPVDAFKEINAHGPLAVNNSDVEVGEVTLADMSPDDIRAELKRLYMQLEIFKNKTICRDNPHISKRRGGRKAQHRRFSLQKKGSREKNLYGKHRAQKQIEQEVTEAEPSRTPEDSVCSTEGTSGIYNDLPSSAHADHSKQ
ncbi:7 transmembrane sweet-taste receptor of 3 GCPR [Popillia japonica]|uniref:7 transmembrane sweet-taste receptor of 3 GCPR n=1 Tax=Popillia japonica TaxID=7064 RepID=A0AAW1JZ64_POPJA